MVRDISRSLIACFHLSFSRCHVIAQISLLLCALVHSRICYPSVQFVIPDFPIKSAFKSVKIWKLQKGVCVSKKVSLILICHPSSFDIQMLDSCGMSTLINAKLWVLPRYAILHKE